MPNSVSSLSLCKGFIRTSVEPGSALEPKEFQAVSILVDSGSQQLCHRSTAVAQRLGATGKLSSFAVAGGRAAAAYLQRGLVQFGHQRPIMPDAVKVSCLVAV
jgi:hypothetical protein